MSAVFSPCGLYRYHLRREIVEGGLFVKRAGTMLLGMLNPSIADALANDPTVRRGIGFAARESMAALEVVNMYAYRATDRRKLLTVADPIGPDNDRWIEKAAATASLIVVAWGAYPYDKLPGGAARAAHVLALLEKHGHVHCLRRTAGGYPEHPLYLPADSPLVPFTEGARP